MTHEDMKRALQEANRENRRRESIRAIVGLGIIVLVVVGVLTVHVVMKKM